MFGEISIGKIALLLYCLSVYAGGGVGRVFSLANV
jgi:hypothetical protein